MKPMKTKIKIMDNLYLYKQKTNFISYFKPPPDLLKVNNAFNNKLKYNSFTNLKNKIKKIKIESNSARNRCYRLLPSLRANKIFNINNIHKACKILLGKD